MPIDVYGLIGAVTRDRGDVFRLRLPLVGTVACVRGAEAARLFYDPERFERAGVLPRRVRATLVGEGGVQTLDDEPHRRRKQMFMALMGPDALAEIDSIFADTWRRYARRWQADVAPVVLYDEVGRILFETVCAWTGVPMTPGEVSKRTADLHAMIETPLAFGPRHQRGRHARRRSEQWLADLIDDVRDGRLQGRPDRALRLIASHRDADGELLDRRTAAVELLNVIRPTVAVDRFVVFVASALHQHHGWAERLRDAASDDPVAEWFVQEVRRTSPFFPFQAARVRRSFRWRDIDFPVGSLVLLDLYGTDHHEQLWPDPDRFAPDRFETWSGGAYDLVPQGGGDHDHGHRCAGEWLTIALMVRATRLLTEMGYDVPPQDLRISRRKVPALPNSGFAVTNVRCPAVDEGREPAGTVASPRASHQG